MKRRHLLAALALIVAGSAACARVEARELAREAGIADAALDVLRREGSNLARLEGMDSLGNRYPAPGVTIEIPEDRSRDAVKEMQERLPAGYVVFVSEQHFNRAPDRVALLRAENPLDAPRVMGTNGANYDIGTDSILSRVADWHRRYGLRLVGAGFDFVEAELVRPPTDWLAFAREVYELSPDVVDQGTETVEALAAEMQRRRTVYLWWD